MAREIMCRWISDVPSQMRSTRWSRQKHVVAAAYAALTTILLPHDYLNYYLTGERFAECGDASGTGLLDISDLSLAVTCSRVETAKQENIAVSLFERRSDVPVLGLMYPSLGMVDDYDPLGLAHECGAKWGTPDSGRCPCKSDREGARSAADTHRRVWREG